MVKGVGQILAGVLILGGVAILAPQGATSASSPACGGPDTAPGFETPARTGSVPDVGCMDLQLARDKAQAAGFNRIAVNDGSGLRRRPVKDRDWFVVAQSPPAGSRSPSNAQLVFDVLRYGDRGAPPLPDRRRAGRMPKLICFDLQEAQDTLQSAGFTRMASWDAAGGKRRQYADRGWTVTGQSPTPGGTHRKSTEVVLRVVKDGEQNRCSVR